MKSFALLSCILFLGVAVAPSIHANISNEFDSKISSPLFNRRITNAIESVDTDLFNCSFIGGESQINIPFSSNREFSRYISYIYRLDEKVDVNQEDISDFINVLHLRLLENKGLDFIERLESKIYTVNATLFEVPMQTVYGGSCFTLIPEVCGPLILIILVELFIFLMLIIFFPTIILLELIREFLRFGLPSTHIECPSIFGDCLP